MKEELIAHLEWLSHRHRILKELIELNAEFETEYFRGLNEGIKQTVNLYGPELEKLRLLVEGYMEEDIDLSGGEEVGTSINHSY